METTKAEVAAVAAVQNDEVGAELIQLHESQLALIGGGAGDILFG